MGEARSQLVAEAIRRFDLVELRSAFATVGRRAVRAEKVRVVRDALHDDLERPLDGVQLEVDVVGSVVLVLPVAEEVDLGSHGCLHGGP